MKMNKADRTNGHVWVAVVVAVATLGGGVLIGFLVGRQAPAGPSVQTVIDFLAKPIPFPKGAKLLKTLGSGSGVGEGFVEWHEDFALDITGMKAEEYEPVVSACVDHFLRQFPMQGGGSGGWTRLHKSDTGFALVMGVEPGWSASYSDGKHFVLAIDTQVIDFEPNPPIHTMSKRQVVRDWSAPPAYGQRVMWLRVSFKGKGLTGHGKWPTSPASPPDQTAKVS